MVFKILIVVAILQVVTEQSITDPVVNTDVGLIKGLRADDGDYSMFLGIPYGKVDEANPFGTATPYPRFENVFEAFSDNVICPQAQEFSGIIAGTPDCLVLNVYVPNSASSINRLPVLIWVHGGGFINGDGNRYLYGPSFLVKQNIILVAINYRLGPYGFMCLDTPKVPGNQGLKDQMLALRWINKHIEAFGGDANKITLSGQSAGSMSVDLHLHSNNEKLFHQVILQSGTAMSTRITGSLKTAPIIIANYLGFLTDSLDDALNYITKVHSHSVMAAVTKLNLSFRPCVEKDFDGVESFLTQNWITADLPKIYNMPILAGFTNDEGHWFHMSLENEHFENINIQNSLAEEFRIDDDGFKGMEDMVRNFYFGDEPMSVAVKRNIIDFDSDVIFVYPTHRSISKYLDFGVGNIFYYMFSYSGERNFFKDFFNYTGATHSDELGYLFDISYMTDEITAEDEIIINRMTTMWANFVKYGNPIPQTSDLLPIQWTPVISLLQRPYLNIDSQMSLGSRPFHDRVTFWDLFYRANKNVLKSQKPTKI